MKYTTIDNQLTTENLNDHMAQTIDMVVNGFDKVKKKMSGPGSILKETEINAVHADYWKAIISFIANGQNYRDEYVSIRMNITGVFEDEDDRYDPARHKIVLSVIPGPDLKEAARQVRPVYVETDSINPVVKSAYDWNSKTTNQKLTSGGGLEIEGADLKIFEGEGQGVFFINASEGFEVKAEHIRTNEPKTLSLSVPDLKAGTYKIEVRNTGFKGKTIRVGLLNINFVVE